MSTSFPLVLCILDGWGYREDTKDNAIAQAHTPNWDRLWSQSPHCLLEASGEDVGLPDGQMGNSEVGHMNIGAGRIVYQDLPRINKAIDEGQLSHNPKLLKQIDTLKKTGGTCHLLGLLSPGGIHSQQTHILAIAKVILDAGVPVTFHPFLDGRDTPPKSAEDYLSGLESFCAEYPNAHIGSISGRFYAMDRDKRWERTELAYNAIVCPASEIPKAPTALAALEMAYEQGQTDEFVSPTVIGEYAGILNGDGVLVANFRADRVRQLTRALFDPEFDGFHRNKLITFSTSLALVEYSAEHSAWLETLFPKDNLNMTLGEVMEKHGLSQLRAAETEKYAHVTFFFNGGRENPFPHEERLLIPSPKVKTYDQQPEMSAERLTKKVTEAIDSKGFDFIVVNYANPDMVGHTGNLEATIKAIEAVDAALGNLMLAVDNVNGTLVITADHGNAETMEDPEGTGPLTSHTLNPVPFVLYGQASENIELCNGRLADVAPTILSMLHISCPAIMTGVSLIK